MKRVTRNAAYNIAGQAIPLLVAAIVVPMTLRGLGADRFAILTITWSIVAVITILDASVGRGVTREAATGEAIRETFWGAMQIQLAIGTVSALTVACSSRLIAVRLLHVPPQLATETSHMIAIVAMMLPVVLMIGCYRSILEAQQRFAVINLLRLPNGIATFLLPALGALYGWSLTVIAALLLAARILALIAHHYVCRAAVGSLSLTRRIEVLKKLAAFGGSMLIANVAQPLLSLCDRVLLARNASLTAVASFAIPSEMVSRAWLIPGSIASAVFPLLCSYSLDRTKFTASFGKMVRQAMVVIIPGSLAVAALAHPVLRLWLGEGEAAAATRPLQLLAFAFIANSIATFAAAGLQALNAPHPIAWTRLASAPLFILLQWFLTYESAATGAALGVVMRTTVDAALLLLLLRRTLPGVRSED
jgi:O-antigen/teichoic acid export membrane protein